MNTGKQVFFKRRPALTAATVGFLSVLIILLLIEISLRLTGERPGFMYKLTWVEYVDSVISEHNYITDNDGIFRLGPGARDTIEKYLYFDKSSIDHPDLSELEFSVRTVIHDFYDTQKSITVDFDKEQVAVNNNLKYIGANAKVGTTKNSVSAQTEFALFYQSLLKDVQTNDVVSEVDNACLQYLRAPVNMEGFRSLPFKNFDTNKPKVLLLGDSFTWGLSAKPITNSFADILLAKGNVVYNSGIICADPAQYLAIADKYVPLLEPDVVIVNFFAANDIMFTIRPIEPNHLIYFPTNAGWLWAYPGGEFIGNPEKAYQYALDETIIQDNESIFNAFCASSVITTKIYWLLMKWGWVTRSSSPEVSQYWEATRDNFFSVSVAEEYLKGIKAVCEKNGSALIIAVIRDYKKTLSETSDVVNIRQLPYCMPDFPTEDYNPDPDGHYNNSGHHKYALFLQAKIDSVMDARKKFTAEKSN